MIKYTAGVLTGHASDMRQKRNHINKEADLEKLLQNVANESTYKSVKYNTTHIRHISILPQTQKYLLSACKSDFTVHTAEPEKQPWGNVFKGELPMWLVPITAFL